MVCLHGQEGLSQPYGTFGKYRATRFEGLALQTENFFPWNFFNVKV